MDKFAMAMKVAKAAGAGRSRAWSVAKRILGGTAVGGGVIGAGAVGHEVGKRRTEKRMSKYPRTLARLAAMASRPGGVHMVARPQYYIGPKGKVRRKIGVRVRSVQG